MEEVVNKSGTGSGLSVSLHPLVIINITDHYTRAKIQFKQQNPQVRGAILGVQKGREVEIINSFELIFDGDKLDAAFLREKQEQFKQVFPDLDFLGWYNTAQSTTKQHAEIHKQFLNFNEAPLFLQLNPLVSPNEKDLPINIFESSLDFVDQAPRVTFIEIGFKIETGEAERLAVSHVASISSSGTSEDSKLATNLGSIKNAIGMLRSRVKVLLEYLVQVKEGKLPPNQQLLREISSLCQRLPTMESEDFKEGLVRDYNDVLLVTYLATITKGVESVNDLVEKFNFSHDRHGRRMRGMW